MAQFASSNFNGTEDQELSVYDANWVKNGTLTGSAEIVSGRARASSTTTACYYYNIAPAGADYNVTADVSLPTALTTGANAAGPAARVSTSANTMYFTRYNAGTGRVELFKSVAGTATSLGTATRAALTAGVDYPLLLDVSGSSINVTWNGEGSPCISTTDTAITAAGYAGIRYLAAGTPTDTFNFQLDNFSADEAGGGAVTHTGTGALTGAGSAITGTASSATTRTASGSLIGPGSNLAGSASRTAGGTTHDATGVLSGAGSTVTGAASRTRVFSSVGVLQGAGALLSGSADRTGAPTVHNASGALLAAGSALSGAAQHKALHTGSGVLAGGGSALVGSASRVGAAVTHTASGVLAGSGSLLDGTGQVGEIVVANGFVFTDTPSALWWKRKPKALSEEIAEQKVNRVVRVIKQIAAKQAPEQSAKQAKREVAQAIAPLIAEMPGFDWTPIYRNIVADFERQREEAARIEAVAHIARIRAIEQDDEDILLLMI